MMAIHASRREGWRSVCTIAGVYLAFGLVWIFLSDWLVDLLSPTRKALSSWQTGKGLAFVLLSTVLIGLLLAVQLRRRRALETTWRDVIELAEEGFWLIDADGLTRMVNQRMASLLGYKVEEMTGHNPVDFAVEEDRPVFERQIGSPGGEGLRHKRAGTRAYEIRLRRCDGRSVPCLVHATSLWSADGRLTGSYAFMTDLSAIRERERELHLNRYAIDNSFDEIYRIDPEGRIVDANRAACRNLGYEREVLLQCRVSDIDSNRPADAWPAHWAELEQKGGVAFETLHRMREGVDYPVEVAVSHVVYDGEAFAYAIARDIRARKAAEASARRASAAQRALSRANSTLIHSEDRDSLFTGVCEALAQCRGYPLVWLGLAGDDAERTVTVAAAAGTARPYLDGLRLSWSEGPGGNHPTGRAIRTGRVQTLGADDTEFPGTDQAGPAQRYGFRAMAALPVQVNGRVIGALHAYAEESTAFDDRELPLLEELAADLGFGVTTLDIRAERDRQLQRLRLAGTVFDNSAEGIVVKDADKRIEMVNRAFTTITGYTAEEAHGRRPEDLLQSGLQDAAFYEEMWSRLRREGTWQGEIRNRRRNGEIYPEWLTISAVRDEAGELTHYVTVFADLTEAHRTREELALRTYHDALTGLPNQARFREYLQQALEGPAPPLAVVQIDLEGFGAINDSFGRAVGDEVLSHVASRLRSLLDEGDLVARAGADEFWLLLMNRAREEEIARTVDSLIDGLAEPMPVADQEFRLKATAGVARMPDDGTTHEVVLNNAATALHSAQESESRVRYFEPSMHAAVQRRVQVSEALKVALERDELRVWFQPQVAPGSGAIGGAEALVRWQHPEWGWVPPATFIPIAEMSGLVAPIGEWVLERALGYMAQWHAAGYVIDRISVNAAAAQLQAPGWPGEVEAALARHDLPPGCLEIELTEASVLDDLDSAQATMHALKALGVRLALDDFGTGYSSLDYLKRLPVDVLKIDKAFIDGLPDEDDDCSIIEAILAVARALELEVIAEGVESDAQADWLRARDVPWIQGYLYHRPGPPEAFGKLLASREGPAP